MIRDDKNMMTLTRNNLVRILDRMDEENANNVKLDIHNVDRDTDNRNTRVGFREGLL